MPENWLFEFLQRAVERDLCTKYLCTTCGAMEFRRGLWRAAEANHCTETDVAQALAHIEGEAHSEDPFARALYLAVTEVCDAIGEAAAARILAVSWAGRVLQSIRGQRVTSAISRKHVEAAQHAAQEAAKERKRQRQARHEGRLEKKRARESWPFPLAEKY